jgi:hypothetical protein
LASSQEKVKIKGEIHQSKILLSLLLMELGEYQPKVSSSLKYSKNGLFSIEPFGKI